jgi:hypothetical protein
MQLLGLLPAAGCRVPEGSVDVVLSYCHNSLHDTSLLEVCDATQEPSKDHHVAGSV